MTALICGGSKSGKSDAAQRMASKMARDIGAPLYYVATMEPSDDEDRERISKHIENRAGLGFETIERCRDIGGVLDIGWCGGVYLVDSVTALLNGEMFPPPDYAEDADAPLRCAAGLCRIANEAAGAVFVADYIFSDAETYDEGTERYRRGLAYICRALADGCDVVAEASAGILTYYKGGAV